MAFEKYTIKEFEDAWFRNDRSVIKTDIEFNQVYTEYVDKANLYEGDDFYKVAYIEMLNNRINSINIAIEAQISFIKEFGFPLEQKLDFFVKFGHNIVWKNSYEDFIKDIEKVKKRERKYISELEVNIKQLSESRNKKSKGKEKTLEELEDSFLTTFLSLGKIGYILDEYKTNLKQYSLVIRKQIEDSK